MRKSLILSFLFFFDTLILFAQSITGRLVDAQNQPVMYAALILQTENNSILGTALSDTVGCFSFAELAIPVRTRLIVQHLSYQTDTLLLDKYKEHPFIIQLKPRENSIGEVVIKAKTPLMKVKEEAFVYNAPSLLRNRVVLNAYESVRELPGVIENNKSLTLAGVSDLKIVINGQQSNLSAAQTLSMLKNLPASKIKEIEVMYDAPAKYNTDGAVINVVLKDKANQNSFSGELMMDYAQAYYDAENPALTLSYQIEKFSLDATAGLKTGRAWNQSVAYTKQIRAQGTNEIEEETTTKSDYTLFNTRVGGKYQFNKKSTLTLSYYYQHEKNNSTNNSLATYDQAQQIGSCNQNRDKNQLHNVNVQYTWNKMNIVADYIYYTNPTTINYTEEGDEERTTLQDLSLQQVHKYAAFVNNTSKLNSRITLGYGATIKSNRSTSHIDYFYADGSQMVENKEQRVYGKQLESDCNVFAEMRYRISKQLFFRASLKSNYFKSDYDNSDSIQTLWNSVILFPSFSLSYSPSQRHNFQCNFSTNRRYPSYWAINPQSTNMSSYTSIEGNPELRPSKSFSGRFIYTYKQKYTFIANLQYVPDYFIQIPHMSDDALKMIYRYENFDYRLVGGLTMMAPIDWSESVTSQIVAMASRTTEKIEHYYNSSFDNTYCDAYVGLNSSFKLTPKWLFQFDVNYRTPSRQGVYKLGYTWGGSTRLRWNFCSMASFTLRYDNIFQHQMPRPMEIAYGNQYRTGRNYEKSEFGVTLSWQLGDFKNKRYKSVDKERLSKQ